MKTVVLLLVFLLSAAASYAEKPNVIVILADDMGYGDIQALNPDSKVPTPNLNRLSTEGMTFTDGHSGSGVCTPTRYGMVMGRYCWRTRLKKGVLNGYSPHLIDPERYAIGDLFKQAGYATACIGKWHLGMDLPLNDKKLDLSGKVKNGPNEQGFEYFYGITASLDFPPYVYIENDRITAKSLIKKPGIAFPHFIRAGETGADFDHEGCLDHLTEKVTDYIGKQAEAKKPFYLYFPLTAPHKPTWPAERFVGKSGIGLYGDFVMQVDWTVGQVLKSLKENGIDENTAVFYTSDNGSYMYRLDSPECPEKLSRFSNKPGDGTDHQKDSTIQGYASATHTANGVFRGTKADIYEGGNHVPFLVRWPARVKAGSKSDHTVAIVDIFKTCADMIGEKVPEGDAEDSFSFYKLLIGQDGYSRPPVITHSSNGCFAMHDKKWKFIATTGSGGRTSPRSSPSQKPYQLYDLNSDISERKNLINERPEKAREMEARLQAIIESSASY